MEEEPDLDLGTPGASGRREHERRRERREDQTRKRHPRLGNLLLKLQDAPEHEKAWATGAGGEAALAASLAHRCPEAIVLHDRRLPGTRANIDHLAIGPSGVYVIDAKRYKGKIEVRKPFFGEAKLFIRGRDKTKLVEGLERQVEAVRLMLNSSELQVPVYGCFCFVNPEGQSGGTKLPLLRTLHINGYPLLFPRKLAKLLKQPGGLDPAQMRPLAEMLAERLPPA
jgi:nuclease-like protein